MDDSLWNCMSCLRMHLSDIRDLEKCRGSCINNRLRLHSVTQFIGVNFLHNLLEYVERHQ